MTVLRIVANIAAPDPQAARAFYEELLGLEVVMDHGWLLTFAGEGNARPQLSVGSEGGSRTAVPDLSIEVDNVDRVHDAAVAAGYDVVYPMTDEPWGVRRFYVRDPLGCHKGPVPATESPGIGVVWDREGRQHSVAPHPSLARLGRWRTRIPTIACGIPGC